MGQPAFCLIGDPVTEPTVARAFVRHESIGVPRLWSKVGSLGQYKGVQSTASNVEYEDDVPDKIIQRLTQHQQLWFPDESVLLMIGNTKELVDACQEAVNGDMFVIGTKPPRRLQLFYARIQVTRMIQADTLIALGPVRSPLLPNAPSKNDWHEYAGWQQTPGLMGQPNFVTTHDEPQDPRALPPIIRWIKSTDGKPWIDK